jgi:SAM-dependent methyltransferase
VYQRPPNSIHGPSPYPARLAASVLLIVAAPSLTRPTLTVAVTGHAEWAIVRDHDVGYTAGQAGAPLPFPAGTFDAAFLAEVIGEVPDKQACVRSLAVVLKPGGKLVFHEAFLDPDRLSVAELRALCEPAGFILDRAERSRWNDIVRFRRTTVSRNSKAITNFDDTNTVIQKG